MPSNRPPAITVSIAATFGAIAKAGATVTFASFIREGVLVIAGNTTFKPDPYAGYNREGLAHLQRQNERLQHQNELLQAQLKARQAGRVLGAKSNADKAGKCIAECAKAVEQVRGQLRHKTKIAHAAEDEIVRRIEAKTWPFHDEYPDRDWYDYVRRKVL